MGQIVGGAAKPKRCNLNKLSQLGTPAAGEYILVSSDNSMNAAGQGNFDCYIKGDGQKTATELELYKIDKDTIDYIKSLLGDFSEPSGEYIDITSQFTPWQSGQIAAKTTDSQFGQVASAGSMRCCATYVDISQYAKLRITLFHHYDSASTGGCVFYNKSKLPISSIRYAGDVSTSQLIQEIIDVPANAQYIRVTVGNSSTNNESVFSCEGETIVQGTTVKEYIDSLLGDFSLPSGEYEDITSQFTPWQSGQIVAKTTDNEFGQVASAGSMRCCATYVDISRYAKLRITLFHHYDSASTGGCVFYNSAKTPISSFHYAGDVSTSQLISEIIDVPANAQYIRVTVGNASTNNESVFSCEGETTVQGVTVKEYIDSKKMSFDGSIDEEDLTNEFVWKDGQLFANSTYASRETFGFPQSANTQQYSNAINVCRCDQLRITLVDSNASGNTGGLCFYDEDMNVVASICHSGISIAADDNVEYTIDVPSNAVYMRTTKVKAGATPFSCYGIINQSDIEKTFSSVKRNINFIDDITGYPVNTLGWLRRYSNCKDWGEQPAANGAIGSFMNVSDGYNTLISDIYEPLRESNPNYISRTNIGLDASGTITMYAYEFTPRYYQQCIVLSAGVHGDEPDAVACLARIMQLICTNPNNDTDIEFIRSNVKIIVIPCVNVWGYTNRSRTNANNANMQGWNSSTLITELQNIKDFLDGKMNEVSFLIDMHTTTNNSYYDFYGVVNFNDKNVRTLFRTNSWLCEHYAKDGRTVDDQYFGYRPEKHTLQWYFHATYGVPTSTLELTDFYWASSKSAAAAITMGVTMWMNYIIQQINDCYNPLYGIPYEDWRESRG